MFLMIDKAQSKEAQDMEKNEEPNKSTQVRPSVIDIDIEVLKSILLNGNIITNRRRCVGDDRTTEFSTTIRAFPKDTTSQSSKGISWCRQVVEKCIT